MAGRPLRRLRNTSDGKPYIAQMVETANEYLAGKLYFSALSSYPSREEYLSLRYSDKNGFPSQTGVAVLIRYSPGGNNLRDLLGRKSVGDAVLTGYGVSTSFVLVEEPRQSARTLRDAVVGMDEIYRSLYGSGLVGLDG